MSPSGVAVLLVSGFGAGLVGNVAGVASLISYPALLAVGLSPLQANVSNTTALVFGGVGNALGSRRELTGQGVRLIRLGAAALAGGAAGAAILLATPGGFEVLVPALVLLASLMVLLTPTPSDLATAHVAVPSNGQVLSVGLIGIYCGYFGAAAGVMLLALLLVTTDESMTRAIAAKNSLLSLCNTVAAVAFAVLAPVRWDAVLPLGIGFLVGGRFAPAVTRRAPVALLRVLTGLLGLCLAAALGIQTYL